MTLFLDLLAKGYDESEKLTLKQRYDSEKGAYQSEIQTLDVRLAENRQTFTEETDKKGLAEKALQEKTALLGALLTSKEANGKQKTDALSELRKAESDFIHYQQGLPILNKAFELVSQEDVRVKRGEKAEEEAYTDVAWYLPEAEAGFEYTHIEPYIGWKDHDYIRQWRDKFKQSAEFYAIKKQSIFTRGAAKKLALYNTEPRTSPHLELKTVLDKRLGTLENPGTFRTEMNAKEAAVRSVRAKLQDAETALHDIESKLPNSQREKDEADAKVTKTIETLETYNGLINDDDIRKTYLEALIKVRDYQMTLLDLRDLRIQYENSEVSLSDVDKPGETLIKLKRLQTAIETLTALNEKYTAPYRKWLDDITALLPDAQFDLVREEEDFLGVAEEIKAHADIVENINSLLGTYQAKERELKDREQKESAARQQKREALVNELLAPDEREGNGAEDRQSVGLINAYLTHRSNHFGTFILDCLQSFWQKIVSFVFKYETEKERRETYINDTYKPALRRYRADGKKEALEASLQDGRDSFKSRTKPESTGYHFTFSYLLKDVINKMPSETDVVEETSPVEGVTTMSLSDSFV